MRTGALNQSNWAARILALALVNAFTASITLAAPVWTITQLTNNLYADSGPAISAWFKKRRFWVTEDGEWARASEGVLSGGRDE